jgi:hypothetical protein
VYRAGSSLALRVLVLDAGALLFTTHVQNLPQRLGGPIGGAPLRTRDDVPIPPRRTRTKP